MPFKSFRKQHPGLALLLACYACGLAALLLWRLGGFVQNRLAYHNGTLAPAELTLADFSPAGDIIEQNGALLTTGGDPQLILNDSTRRVENLTIEFTYSQPPLLVEVFWAEPGQDYATTRKACPVGDGATHQYLLPTAGGQSLRIDPGIVAGNTIKAGRVLINQPRRFVDFFRFSALELMLLAVVPGLAACLFAALGNLGFKPPRFGRKKQNPAAQKPRLGTPPQPNGKGGAR